ncbi:thiamine-triphosphatase-like [Dermacentor andersoni]|uniref:thiamine-triphosphatase-like n=1 Tax=Dermacentor andersoni TaxID=34620 RepID=UPI0021550166|nr:thiamine-triphosphatase-like [Dermacentor andersoni]
MTAAEPAARCREIERKFRVPPDVERRLLALGASLVSRRTFVDAYYDTEDYFLCLRDHWLRLRSDENNTWELKHRRKGDASCGAAAAYREVRGDAQIMATLGEVLPRARLVNDAQRVSDLVANGTLRELALITTVRKTFKAPGMNAVVDIDETDWGFSVGEIEVVLVESDDGSDLAGADVERATAEIAALSSQLGVDEEGPPPEGKVESYLKLRRPELYYRLLDCIWSRHKATDI